MPNEYEPNDPEALGLGKLPLNIPSWAWWLFVAILATSLIGLNGKRLYTLRPLPGLSRSAGQEDHISARSSAPWARIPVLNEHCYLANNIWNAKTASSDLRQEILTFNSESNPAFGWRWRAPSQVNPGIVAYPELICGVKPWDAPMGNFVGFPFHPVAGSGAPRISANFQIQLEAAGTYNMAFSLWAVSDLPATPETIRTEIMIWNVNSGQRPSGTRRGELTVAGTTYDIWVNDHQTDASGKSRNTWTYVAFVARKKVLTGPLEISRFLEYSLQQNFVTSSMYITDLELGDEVAQGAGVAEIRNFNVQFIP